jgi:hypothetical protein
MPATQNWYFGNDRSMLLPNCLFRVGGAAMLLSNRRRDAWRAKYELMHTVRTHLGAMDAAYKCIFQVRCFMAAPSSQACLLGLADLSCSWLSAYHISLPARALGCADGG